MTQDSLEYTNPLIEGINDLPYDALPYGEVDYKDVVRAFQYWTAVERDTIDDIINNSEPPTIKNTFIPYVNAGRHVSRISSYLAMMKSTGELDDEAGETIYEAIERMTRVHEQSITFKPEMYKKIQQVHKNLDNDPDATDEARRFIDKTLKAFLLTGVTLDDKSREEFLDIFNRIHDLRHDIRKNHISVLSAVSLTFSEEELSGLPDNILRSMRRRSRKAGVKDKIRVTFTGDDYGNIMAYCDNPKTRRRIYKERTKVNTQEPYNNYPLIQELLVLRQKKAEILGYADYASMTMEHRIMRSPDKVTAFVDNLADIVEPQYEKDRMDLEQYAHEEHGQETLEPWDINYYSRLYHKAMNGYEYSDIEPYFTVEHVMKTYFEHTEQLYGVRLVEDKDLPTPHKDVHVYRVYKENKTEGEPDSKGHGDDPLGLIYMDLYWRQGKRKGASARDIQCHYMDENGDEHMPHVYVRGSFTKADPDSDEIPLMSISNLRTLLHETGHAMHVVLSQTPQYEQMSGFNVVFDAVEIPSKLAERWLGVKEVLQKFSKHKDTGEPLPEELYEKIKQSSRKRHASGIKSRIMQYGIDIAIHQAAADDMFESGNDLEKFEKDYLNMLYPDGRYAHSNILPRFSHITAGDYACAVYTYKLNEIIAYRMFEEFKTAGNVYDPVLIEKLNSYLDAGDTQDARDLIEEFIGTKTISMVPYLEAKGLIPEDTPRDQFTFELP